MSVIFGKYLLNLRKKKPLTRKELSAISHISEMSIRRYESGERTPSVDIMQKLAEALGVPAEDMIENYKDCQRFETELGDALSGLEESRLIKRQMFLKYLELLGYSISDQTITFPGESGSINYKDESMTDIQNTVDSVIDYKIWKLWKKEKFDASL